LCNAKLFHETPPIKSHEQDPNTLLKAALEVKDPTAMFVAGAYLNALDAQNDPRLNDPQ
jgi:hypothetical protein